MKKIAYLLCLLLAILPMVGLAEEAAEAPEELREKRQAAALPEVLSVTADKSAVKPGEAVQFAVETTGDAKFLALFSENGTKCKVWGMTGNSVAYGGNRKWTVSYAFKCRGEREITFRAAATRTYGPDSGKVNVSVQTTNLKIVSYKIPGRSEDGRITVEMEATEGVKYVTMFAEGKRIKSFEPRRDTFRMVEGNRHPLFYFTYTIKNKGYRVLTFKVSADGVHFGDEVTQNVAVYPKFHYSPVKMDKDEITAGDEVTFTVTTDAHANYLICRTESEGDYKVWAAPGNSQIVGDKRVWTVKLTISIPGRPWWDYKRSISFTPGYTKKTYGNEGTGYAAVYVRPRTTE